jgi:C1A family cysteine protease
MKSWMIIALLSLSFAAHAGLSPKTVNALIKAENANWIAGNTSVSNLSDVEAKRLFGSTDCPQGDMLFEDRTKGLDQWDWRNVNGVNWVGKVLDQGQCGSCVAFGSVATLETQYRINSGLTWLAPSFSPQQLFNCGGGACDSGWYAQSAADTLVNKGIVDSACSPYVSGVTGKDVQCRSITCNNQVARTYKITGYDRPSSYGGTASAVKEALKRGPLVTNMTVYNDFMTYTSGIYKSVSNEVAGGHVVSLVGFNDLERYWVIRNSWGPGWGEGGFARISYDDKSGIAESTWLYKTAKEDNVISVTSPAEREYISGQKNFIVKMTKPTAAEVFLTSDKGVTFQKFSACSGEISECSMTLDTLSLKEGRYEIHAQAAGKRSVVREFYVVNSEPQTALSFSGVDLTKTQTGKIFFNVDITKQSVIPQKLSLVLENATGEKIVNKTTDVVLEKMAISLRTPAVANGTYTMYFKAETPLDGKAFETFSEKKAITIKN